VPADYLNTRHVEASQNLECDAEARKKIAWCTPASKKIKGKIYGKAPHPAYYRAASASTVESIGRVRSLL
jgi:hypothetical protein